MSDTFCILPWIHIYANADGSVIPCCIAHHHTHLGNVRNNTLEEIWNGESYKTLRKNMLQGVRSPECRACYKNEDTGIRSFRESINERFEKHIPLKDLTNSDGSLDEMHLRYLDLRWSNICNFKCRSCSSTYSSSWAKENGNKNVYIFAGGENNESLYNQIKPHLFSIEEFYFAGGEPLLTDKHYEILNYLINNNKTDVKLRYNTNMSVLKYKNQSVVELWKKFPNISIGISLDSWGQKAEYIREGTEWQTILENIQTIKTQLPHITIEIHTVSSIFNVYSMNDFFDYLLDEKIIDNTDPKLYVYNIQNPDMYTYATIPTNIKTDIIKKLQSKTYNSSLDDRIQEIISSLNSYDFDERKFKKFKEITKYYDDKRSRSLLDTFPELYNMWFY